MINEICTLVNEEYERTQLKNVWSNSLYKNIDLLKCDTLGKIGELFIYNFCKKHDIMNDYKKDIISKDGIYDIIIKNKRIEIKTARYGMSKTFQHESLRNEGCDFYMFIDIKPTSFFITILPKFNLADVNVIMNRKPHLRHGTTNVYKFDFSEKNIKLSIKNGSSIEICQKTNEKDLIKFINNNI